MLWVPFFIALPSVGTEALQSIFPRMVLSKQEDDGYLVKLYQDPDNKNGMCLVLYLKVILQNITLLGTPSVAPSGRWTLCLILPLGIDTNGDDRIGYSWTAGTKAFRLLAALAPRITGRILGPWSPNRLLEIATNNNINALIDIFYSKKPATFDAEGNPLTWQREGQPRLPVKFAGDPDATYLQQIDYRPTSTEISDDTETTEAILSPPLGLGRQSISRTNN